jgi:serine/threonine-protein phosphatase 2A regulatory subunit A
MLNTYEIMEQGSASSLLEDLKSQDQKIKINAIRGLHAIASALGKERTRNELLPYISGI